jgi:uncharacterized protein DUF3152
MRRGFLILAGRARQPGMGTIGAIGTITAVLLAVALWAVPSTASRTPDDVSLTPFFTPAVRTPPPVVRLTVTAPQAIRGSSGGIVSAVATPASAGTVVVFETRGASGWKAVASASQDAAGRAIVRFIPSAFGAVDLRARIADVASSASVQTLSVRRNARVYTWREWIEKPSWNRAEFVGEVSRVLADPRGWGATGEVSFQHISSGTPRMWVKLATPRTTDRLCAPTQTRGIWNCRNHGGVVVNSDRWFTGRASWPGSIDDYRGLIINHETGHVLGFGHRGCARSGRAAPVMQQQGVSLEGCRANAWPLASELARL